MSDLSKFVSLCEDARRHAKETPAEACERLASWAARCYELVVQVGGDDALADLFPPRGRAEQHERDPYATGTGLFHGHGCSEANLAMVEKQLGRKIPRATRQLLLSYRWLGLGTVTPDATIDLDALVELDDGLRDMAQQLDLPQLHDRYLLFAGDLEQGYALDLQEGTEHDPPVCWFSQEVIANNLGAGETNALLDQVAVSFSSWVSQTVDRAISRMIPSQNPPS